MSVQTRQILRRWVSWVLAIALVLGVSIPAAAQDLTKDEARVTKAAKQIDASAGRADAKKASERLAAEFSTVVVRTSASDQGHALTSADVQALRSKGLGYGEIAIVLSLYANQKPGTTFMTLDQIVALKQPGQGWGQVAKSMGYDSLGAMKRDMKRASKGLEAAAKPMAKAEKTEKMDKAEKPSKPEKPEKVEKPERAEKAGR